jgi:hypothetical protein
MMSFFYSRLRSFESDCFKYEEANNGGIEIGATELSHSERGASEGHRRVEIVLPPTPLNIQ